MCCVRTTPDVRVAVGAVDARTGRTATYNCMTAYTAYCNQQLEPDRVKAFVNGQYEQDGG